MLISIIQSPYKIKGTKNGMKNTLRKKDKSNNKRGLVISNAQEISLYIHKRNLAEEAKLKCSKKNILNLILDTKLLTRNFIIHSEREQGQGIKKKANNAYLHKIQSSFIPQKEFQVINEKSNESKGQTH